MDNAMNFMRKLGESIINGINSSMLGKIESFDSSTMKADVSPLVNSVNKAGESQSMPLLVQVPVSFLKAGPFIIRPPYKPGDIVLVVFADSDIDNALLSGSVSTPNSTRKHSLDDAIVVGSIMPYTVSLPSEHADDLVIGTDDFKSKIVLSENGNIIIESEEEIEIKSNKKVTITGPSNNTIWDWGGYVLTFLMKDDDYVLDENKNLILISGIDEIRQSVERILTTNIGEWFLNTDFGLDYKALQGKGKDLQSIELAIRTAIFQDDRIEDIIFHKIDLNKQSRHLDIQLDAVVDNEVIAGIEVSI